MITYKNANFKVHLCDKLHHKIARTFIYTRGFHN